MQSNCDAFIAVPGRLNPVDEDRIIAGANTIWDDELGRRQSDINKEIDEAAASLDRKIETAVAGISSQVEDHINEAIEQIDSVMEVVSSFSQESKRTISLSVSPSIVFKGERTIISLIARCGTSASSIQILNGSNVILEGDGMQLSGEDTVTTLDNMVYTAKFNYGDVSFSTKETIRVVNPIYYGAAVSYPAEGVTFNQLPPTESPEGIYHIEVTEPGSHIYFEIPASMSIKSATMGSVEFPLEESESINIRGEEYKSYRSSNTYKIGSVTIVLT